MTYLYHYHSMHQQVTNGTLYADGVIVADRMISTGENFLAARENIAKKMGLDSSKEMTLCSLTLLNPH